MANRNGLIGAIDLGGTKILSLVVDERGAVCGEDLRPTEATAGPEAVLARMRDSLQAALRAAGQGTLLAAGLSVPGPVDAQRGVVAQAPNLPGWRNVPVGERLREQLGCPVVVENDANAATWGEFTAGSGAGCRHMIFLTISTGIGGGLILDGRLYRGANGAAGELGHVPLLPDGPFCGCHARGCLETLASGTAIARDAAKAVADGEAPLLERLAAGGPITAAHVHEAAEQGERTAIDIVDRAARYLGSGLVAFVNIFNPDVIVIGGGTAKIGDRLLDPAIEEMRTRSVHPSRDHVRVVPAALGDRACALGAAALARGQ
jgi:glucokinase